MTPELWERVKTVFDAARERPPGERARFLDAACGADAALRVEVESLLAADTETLLDPPRLRVEGSLEDIHSQLRTALAERYRVARDERDRCAECAAGHG